MCRLIVADNALFGIDIGTTNYSVCIYETPHDMSFLTENTKASFPSLVTCSKTKERDFLFCQGTKKHSECTICETKRLIGMHFDSPEIQELVKNKHLESFALILDKGGRVKVEFVKGRKTLTMDPWEVSSTILRHLHGLVCKKFNYDDATKVKAVISIPANFTHFRRAETMRAGRWWASTWCGSSTSRRQRRSRSCRRRRRQINE